MHMHEIRIVGRGGQGVVTAGDLLGRAALLDGRQAQSIPSFGPERRGAPAQAILRLADAEILLKCTAARPGVVLVLDPTIWHFSPVTAALREGATLVFNTSRAPEDVERDLRAGRFGYQPAVADFRVVTVDATAIALEVIGKPITNTAMMGAFVGATGLLGMPAVEASLHERFAAKASANIEAARRAHARLRRCAPIGG